MCKIDSKLLIKTSERRHWRLSGVYIANFEQVIGGWKFFLRRQTDFRNL